MEYETDYYVTLSSRGCRDVHPENQNNNFKITLPRELNLRDYRVALCDVIFTPSFVNLRKGSNRIMFGYYLIDDNREQIRKAFEIEVPEKNYSNIEELVSAVNKSFKEKEYDWVNLADDFLKLDKHKVKISEEFKIDLSNLTSKDATNYAVRLHVAIHKKVEVITFDYEIATMLGFKFPSNEYKSTVVNPKVVLAEEPKEICIYANFIEQQIVSGRMVSLLRVLGYKPTIDKGDILHIEFSNRNYLQAYDCNMRTLEIEFKDTNGNLIPLNNSSDVILILHFIKRRL